MKNKAYRILSPAGSILLLLAIGIGRWIPEILQIILLSLIIGWIITTMILRHLILKEELKMTKKRVEENKHVLEQLLKKM